MAAKRGQITSAEYAERYTAEMRLSYSLAFGKAGRQPRQEAAARSHRGAWETLLGRERIVLCCYCPDPALCHRRLLADMLVKAGEQREIDVRYAGELAS
jgi:hypothetical protein